MRDEERTHRTSGADHAPVWEQSSTVDGKACQVCREQAERVTEHEHERAVNSAADGICEWFAGCRNAAVRTEHHPVLGEVPICGRCTDWLRRMSAERSRDND